MTPLTYEELLIQASNIIYALQNPDHFYEVERESRSTLLHRHEYIYKIFKKKCVHRIQQVDTTTGKRLQTQCTKIITLGQSPKKCKHVNCMPLNCCYPQISSVFKIKPLSKERN